MKYFRKILTVIVALSICGCVTAKKQSGSAHVSQTIYDFYFSHTFKSDYSGFIESLIRKNNKNSEKSGYNLYHGKYNNNAGLFESLDDTTFPDFHIAEPYYAQQFFTNSERHLVDISKYVERYNNEKKTNLLSGFVKNSVEDSNNFSIETDGKTFGLPFCKKVEVMQVNKYYLDFFQTFDNSITVPSTWDELNTIAPKINQIVNEQNLCDFNNMYLIGKIDSNSGKAYDFRLSNNREVESGETVIQDISGLNDMNGFRPCYIQSPARFLIESTYQWGSELNNGQKFAFWNSENRSATKQMILDFKQMHSNAVVGFPTDFNNSGTIAPFEEGNCLFVLTLNYQPYYPDRIDVYPTLIKNNSRKYVFTSWNSLYMFEKTNTDKQGYEVFKACVDLSSNSLNSEFCAETGYFPTSNASLNSDRYSEYLNMNLTAAAQKYTQRIAKLNKETYSSWTGVGQLVFDGHDGFESYNGAFHNILFNDAGIDTAMNEVWNSIQEEHKI